MSVVKIVKRGTKEQKNLPTGNQDTGQQSQRKIVSTVKSWIADLQRRRAEERAYSVLTR